LNLIRVIPAKGQDIVATSIFLARLIGPLFVIFALSILVNPNTFRTMANDVVRNVTLVYLFGLIDFAAGLAIVLTHNVWIASWRVLITILGWLMVVRGAARVLFPEIVMAYAARVFHNKLLVPASGAVAGILGLIFCYFGYVA
jgi:hypothetical protein